jgi:hypothetical protein
MIRKRRVAIITNIVCERNLEEASNRINSTFAIATQDDELKLAG